MTIGIVAVGIAIFKAGLIAGILFGIASTFNAPVDKIGVSTFILDQFCELDLLDNEITQYNCDVMRNWLIVISIIALIVSVFAPIVIFGHWAVGLTIYVVGWVLGYFTILYVTTGG